MYFPQDELHSASGLPQRIEVRRSRTPAGFALDACERSSTMLRHPLAKAAAVRRIDSW
jgi:hypothetical protein